MQSAAAHDPLGTYIKYYIKYASHSTWLYTAGNNIWLGRPDILTDQMVSGTQLHG